MSRMRRRAKWILIGVLWLWIGVAGAPPTLGAEKAEEGVVLRVALLPILDVFPFYVAETEGYFAENKVNVKAVPVTSGLERDQLMQAGQIDGMLTEMSNSAAFNRRGVQVKIVSVARKAYSDYPLFRLVAAPGSGLDAPSKLANVPIAVSMNTIIEYVTDRLLMEKGLKPEQIVKKSVPVIPERYQLLMQGQLKAATLPDPLAKSALASGAISVIDDSAYPLYSASVLSFSRNALENKAGAVRGFLRAWNRAAEKINQNPEAYRPLLLKRIRVPKNIQQTYKIPPYPLKMVPTAEQWADVMKWMIAKGILDKPLAYGGSVTREFLP